MPDEQQPPPAYPSEIQAFHDALSRLRGVYEVSSGIETLDGITQDDLRFVEWGHLPIGALRRTGGGLAGEALVQFEFCLSPDASGWRSLEFLAWWTRDAARGGEQIQMRPYALPPRLADVAQLGQTLRFHIDLFIPGGQTGLPDILAKISGLAKFLQTALNLYASEVSAPPTSPAS